MNSYSYFLDSKKFANGILYKVVFQDLKLKNISNERNQLKILLHKLDFFEISSFKSKK